MTVHIKPGRASGRIPAPPSKSSAHRLLISAALAEGESRVCGISDCEDVLATIDCLSALGVECIRDGSSLKIRGTDPKNAPDGATLRCRESGSTLRFLLPIALLSGKRITLVGAPRLMQRPMNVYSEIAETFGLEYRNDGDSIHVKGPLTSGEYTVVGNISSQFISGLLFALPLVDGDSRIHIIPPVESRSYINLTIGALSEFGIEIKWQDDCTVFIKGNQKYIAHDTSVEGDYSNAAFLSAFNLFGGDVELTGLLPDSLQGDKVYEKYFHLLCGASPEIHIGDCPDLGPIFFAIAAAKNGASFKGTERLKIKESDRACAMAEELRLLGAAVDVSEDSVTVYPATLHSPNKALDGHNDHRIVMSLSVLLSIVGGSIKGAEAANKSYPGFFDDIRALGIEVCESEEKHDT